MKRALIVLSLVVLLVWLGIVVLQTLVPSSEVSNAADFDDLPEFFVSDPALTHVGPHRVQARAVDSSSRTRDRVPYFIQLADGRYACGYTDAHGDTRPVFTQVQQSHEVVWDDEAWNRWLAVARNHAP